MEKIIQRLTDLKSDIEKAKLQKAQAEGSIKELMNRLSQEFNLTSIDKAELKLEQLKREKDKLEQQIEDAVEELENEFEW